LRRGTNSRRNTVLFHSWLVTLARFGAAASPIDTFTLSNSGSLTGGTSDNGRGGVGLVIGTQGGAVSNVFIDNAGSIAGAAGIGGGGCGTSISTVGADIDHVIITNSGTITGATSSGQTGTGINLTALGGTVSHLGYGTFANFDDARFTSSGVITGVDHRLSKEFTGGVLVNFASTHASLDGIGSGANVGGFGGGVFGGWQSHHWYANGLLTYDRITYRSHRRVLFPGFDQLAVGRTNGDQIVADLTLGNDAYRSAHWTAGPEFGLQYVHLGVEDFAESGFAGVTLNVAQQTLYSFRSRLGGRATYRTPCREKTFALQLRALWQHEFDDESRTIGAAFESGGFAPFAVQTTGPVCDAVLAGVGASLSGTDLSSYVRYDIQAADHATAQYASAGLRFRF
jgi:uncharacterized protein YhjY with autotransporter beta-barrel domain